MTPKQRQQKIESIEAILSGCDFKQDSYGNWKNQLNGIQYRAKLKKVNLRLERKVGDRWINIKSAPVSSFELKELAIWATKFVIK
jgi:hypothetical protein